MENNDGELIRRDKIQSCGEIESNRRLEFAGGVRMKCPVCGNEFKKGVIEAKDAGRHLALFVLVVSENILKKIKIIYISHLD